MAKSVHHGVKEYTKEHSISEAVRLQNREETERCKKSKKFRHLFYKRTKVQLNNGNEDTEILSIEDVKVLSKELAKKSGKVDCCLESLIKAFRTNPSYVDAFLEQEKALWNLVSFLTGKDSKLQIYAAYCIANITSVDHKYCFTVAKSCSSYLITYLSSEVPLKQDLSATALGNIASDGEEFRELLKAQGIVKPLVNLFKSISPAVLEAASFVALQLCAGSEETTDEFLALGCGQLLITNLKTCKSEAAISQMAWFLFYLASSEVRLGHLLELGLLYEALQGLQIMSSSVRKNVVSVTAFLRIVGNATMLSKEHDIETLKGFEIVKILKPLIECDYAHVTKEAVWVTSNLIALDGNLASTLINGDILQSLGRCMNYGESIQKEDIVVGRQKRRLLIGRNINKCLLLLSIQFGPRALPQKFNIAVARNLSKNLPQVLVMICVCSLSSYGEAILQAVADNANILDHSIQLLHHINSDLSILALQFLNMALRLAKNFIDSHKESRIYSALIDLAKSEDATIQTLANELKTQNFSCMNQEKNPGFV